MASRIYRKRRPGFFSSKSNTNGPSKPNGNGGDGDDVGKPNYTAPESVKETEERVERIQEYVRKLEEETESESESQCQSAEELQVDESYKENPDLKKVTKNTSKNKRAVKNLEEVQ